MIWVSNMESILVWNYGLDSTGTQQGQIADFYKQYIYMKMRPILRMYFSYNWKR